MTEPTEIKEPTKDKFEDRLSEGTADLASQIERVAKALERQNRFRNRLMLGIVFGVGTAIGASIIASLLVVSFSRLMSSVGLKPIVDPDILRAEVQRQIQTQTPQ
jgi:hypothetical protein